MHFKNWILLVIYGFLDPVYFETGSREKRIRIRVLKKDGIKAGQSFKMGNFFCGVLGPSF